MIDKAFEFIKNNKHSLLALSWLVDGIMYLFCQFVISQRTPIIFHIPLDDHIPFIEYFVIPYVLWYPYIFAVSLYLLLKSKEGFINLYIALIAGMAVCYTTSLIFPLYFDRTGSPMLYARENIFTEFCRVFHDGDEPTNIMPSLHVYMSAALAWAFAKYADKKHLIWKILSVLLAVIISLSTVFIKQHSALDGFVALFAAAVICPAAFSRSAAKEKNKPDPTKGTATK